MVLITRYLFYMKSLNTQRDLKVQVNPKLILNLWYFGDWEKDFDNQEESYTSLLLIVWCFTAYWHISAKRFFEMRNQHVGNEYLFQIHLGIVIKTLLPCFMMF